MKKVETVLSPLTKEKAILFDKIPTDKIIDEYKLLGLDVNRYFQDVENIYVYECAETKYRFYYPFLAGDEEFYENVQDLHSYYDEWKWENELATKFIESGDTVLDIGCGEGYFLDQIRQRKNCRVYGLEFNNKSIEKCKLKDIEAQKIPIADFAKENISKFDIVCCFQVLEHIVDVREFLDSAIQTLKPNGKLIIGVPNNKPYIFYQDKLHALNLPPHHLGLWNKESLFKVAEHFKLKTLYIEEESSNKYLWFYEQNYFKLLTNNTNSSVFGLFYKIIDRILKLRIVNKIYSSFLKAISNKLVGHSIVSVYEKQ